MRRIVIWLASTVTVVVLLFGYHTSTNKTTSGTTEDGTSGSTTSAGNRAQRLALESIRVERQSFDQDHHLYRIGRSEPRWRGRRSPRRPRTAVWT